MAKIYLARQEDLAVEVLVPGMQEVPVLPGKVTMEEMDRIRRLEMQVVVAQVA